MYKPNFGIDIIHMVAAAMASSGTPDAAITAGYSGWERAPYGTSKRTAAQDQRASRKRKAKRRARRLGHA